MTVLLDITVPRTVDALVARFAEGHRGASVEAWVFDNAAARRVAEARLAAAGAIVEEAAAPGAPRGPADAGCRRGRWRRGRG